MLKRIAAEANNKHTIYFGGGDIEGLGRLVLNGSAEYSNTTSFFSSAPRLSRAIESYGQTSFTGKHLNSAGGGSWTNHGVFDFQGDGDLGNAAEINAFTNAIGGTLVKSVGATNGSTDINWQFENLVLRQS